MRSRVDCSSLKAWISSRSRSISAIDAARSSNQRTDGFWRDLAEMGADRFQLGRRPIELFPDSVGVQLLPIELGLEPSAFNGDPFPVGTQRTLLVAKPLVLG